MCVLGGINGSEVLSELPHRLHAFPLILDPGSFCADLWTTIGSVTVHHHILAECNWRGDGLDTPP